MTDETEAFSELSNIAKINGDFWKNYGMILGAFATAVGPASRRLSRIGAVLTRAAVVPTRLTKFSAETRRLLIRAGYAHTAAALAASRVPIPHPCPPSFNGLPNVC